jgi:hypothetical protein
MKKDLEKKDFILTGRLISNKNDEGVAGISIHAINSNSKKIVSKVISNENGGFHFIFRSDEKDLLNKISIIAYDIDNKEIFKAKEAVKVIYGGQKEIKLEIEENDIQNHLNKCTSLRPISGRVFPLERLNEIYSAINLYGNTPKKYYFGGDIKPGLTCPFPEFEDYDNVLDDAWGVNQGEMVAIDRFRSTLDSIHLNKTKRGAVKLNIDFDGKDWKNFIKVKKAKHKHVVNEDNAIIPLKNSALLMRAANILGKKDKILSNHYMNVVLDQIIEYFEVSSIYKTAHNALCGDKTAQSNIRSMIKIWGEDCGGRGPIPDPLGDRGGWDPNKVIDPNMEHQLECIDALLQTQFINYKIDSLTPSNGCAGDTAIIKGSGFSLVKQVKFIGTTKDSSVLATPTRLTDTEIELQIPNGATYGPIDLRFPFGNGKIICGFAGGQVFSDISDHLTYFTGGKPRIDEISFQKNGVTFDPHTETVLPDETVSLIYQNPPNAPQHSYNIRESQINLDNGQFLPSVPINPFNDRSFADGGPTLSVKTFPQMRPDRSTQITCNIALTNHCGTTEKSAYYVIHRPATISLTGIEITQATQFFKADRHIALASEHKPDNSIPLIADKQTLVRVYYRTNQAFTFNQGKSYGLRVDLQGFMDDTPLSQFPLSPFNVNALIAQRRGGNFKSERSKLTSSANFLLPENFIVPTQRQVPTDGSLESIVNTPLSLIANLGTGNIEPWTRDRIDINADQLTLTGLNFNRANSLMCMLVRVSYTGPGSVSATPPSINAATRTLSKIRNVYPTAELEVFLPPNEDDRVITFTDDLTAIPGPNSGCGDAWNNLLTNLRTMAFFTTNDDRMIWVALLNPIPVTQNAQVSGCGGPTIGAKGVAAFPSDSFEIGAQETAHGFGISKHANEPGSGFPDYNLDGSSSIGEFGVDIGRINLNDLSNIDNLVFDPTTIDFMFNTAGTPRWTSPFTYKELSDLFFSPRASSGNPQSSSAVVSSFTKGNYIFISGLLDKQKKECVLNPIFHLPEMAINRKSNPSDYDIVLLDSSEQMLFKGPLYNADEEMGHLSIFQLVPYFKSTKSIEIREKDVTIFKTTRSENSPELLGLELKKEQENYSLKWEIRSKSEKHWCGIQLTCDDGKTWVIMKIIESKQTYSFNPLKYGGGEKCRLRVFVTDGFNTTYKETDTFSLPIKPPQVVPINFDNETKFIAGLSYKLKAQPVYIMGVPHQIELIWYLNEKKIGKGKEISISFKEGKHNIKVVPENFEDAAITIPIVVKKAK